MTETLQTVADTAPLDPRQLVLPSLTAMVEELVRRLPPPNPLAALQAGQLLQQVALAMDTVQLGGPARLMQALHAAVERLRTGPAPAETTKAGELLTLAARDTHTYLQALQQGESPDVQTLFASFRAVTRLAGKDTAHPADLWDVPWNAAAVHVPPRVPPMAPDPAIRALLDQQVLAIIQSGDTTAATDMRDVCLGLSGYAPDGTLWKVAAGWLDALAQRLIEPDLYAKRLASRLLMQYAQLAKGSPTVPPLLLRDLLFHCDQAAHAATGPLPPVLQAVCHSCGLLVPPSPATPVAHANSVATDTQDSPSATQLPPADADAPPAPALAPTAKVDAEATSPPNADANLGADEAVDAQLDAQTQAMAALADAALGLTSAPQDTVHTHAEADTPAPAPQPLANTATADAETTAKDGEDAATARAPTAPLPTLHDVPEIQPVETLLQGQAGLTPHIVPDAAFLHEAELLSEQLLTRVTAWQADAAAPCPLDAAPQAHTLSRSAWSAGCSDIATLAHLMQRVLARCPTDAPADARATCVQAAEEIRRLLHQFAAGFLRRAHPVVLDAMEQLLAQWPQPGDTASADAAAEAGDMPAQPPHTDSGASSAADPDREDSATPSAAEQAHAALARNAPSALDPVHFGVLQDEMQAVWPALQAALQQWCTAPADGSQRQALLRHLHTLKGSARLAGALSWASQVHALEGLALDVLAEDGARGPASLREPLEALRIAFVALQQEMADRHPERAAGRWGQQPMESVARHSQALWATHQNGQQTLEQSALSMTEMARCLQRLRSQIKDCAAWGDTLMLHGGLDLPYEWHEELHDLVHALDDCTDDLGTVHQQLQHGLDGTHSALSTQSGHLRALQHTLLYAQLVPLSQLQDRLQQTVQLAARDTNKPVQLQLQGADTLMDRKAADALAPALEHLLRNSVVHGIEPLVQRSAASKPDSGSLVLTLATHGTQQTLTLVDDGRGLDLHSIQRKAVALGLIEDGEPVDHARAAALILQPGLSTAPVVTELAGRGIGMDVVADTVARLGGTLHIDSAAGLGCRCTITLPAPPQVEQVLALRAGNWRVALPAHAIEAVRRMPQATVQAALAQGVLQDDVTGPMPLYWAGAVWQQSARSQEASVDGQRTVLVVRGDTSRWGVVVDEVLGTQEVTLQAPAEMTVTVPGLLGTAAQPSGHVLQVYAAAAALGAHEARLLANPTAPQPPAHDAQADGSRPWVLLADDSLSVRRLAQHLLQFNGYRVTTAADGLEAWSQLQSGELPALLLADIEMPNMDGMELLRRVRGQAQLKQLPVVMLTAHEAGPVSQQAIGLGAQAYLTKPYSPNELLAQVRRYCGAGAGSGE